MRILKYGTPNGVGFFIDISSFTFFVFIAGNLGTTALAANNIIFSIQLISFMPIIGMGMGILTLVGQYVGAKRHDLAIQAVFNGFKLVGSYVLILSVLFLTVPQVFVGIFGTGKSGGLPEILNLTYKLMKILPLFIIADMVQITFADAIKGAGDTKFQMITAVVCAWGLFVPGVYIISKTTGRIEHILLWACFYLTCMGVTFFLRFKSNKWQKIDIIRK
jgi:MATE family multidrug resistance protein